MPVVRFTPDDPAQEEKKVRFTPDTGGIRFTPGFEGAPSDEAPESLFQAHLGDKPAPQGSLLSKVGHFLVSPIPALGSPTLQTTEIPMTARTPQEVQRTFPFLGGTGSQVVSGIDQAIANQVRGLVSPLTVGTLGAGAGVKALASPLLSTTFGAGLLGMLGYGGYQGLKQAVTASDLAGKIAGVGQAGLSLAPIIAGGKLLGSVEKTPLSKAVEKPFTSMDFYAAENPPPSQVRAPVGVPDTPEVSRFEGALERSQTEAAKEAQAEANQRLLESFRSKDLPKVQLGESTPLPLGRPILQSISDLIRRFPEPPGAPEPVKIPARAEPPILQGAPPPPEPLVKPAVVPTGEPVPQQPAQQVVPPEVGRAGVSQAAGLGIEQPIPTALEAALKRSEGRARLTLKEIAEGKNRTAEGGFINIEPLVEYGQKLRDALGAKGESFIEWSKEMGSRLGELPPVLLDHTWGRMTGMDARDMRQMSRPFRIPTLFYSSEIDKVRKSSPILADAMTTAYEHGDPIIGMGQELLHRIGKEFEVQNPVVSKLGVKNPISWLAQDNAKTKKVGQSIMDDQYGREPTVEPLTSAEQSLKDDIYRTFLKAGQEFQKRPGLQQGELTGQYFPVNMKPQIRNTLVKGGPEAAPIEARFQEYNALHGVSPEETAAQIAGMRKQINSNEINLAAQFGPLDLPAGFKIPPEYADTNLMGAIQRYFSRAARRVGYYDAFESRPEVMDELGKVSTPSVQAVMRDISGQRLRDHEWMEGLHRAVSTTQLATETGLRDAGNAVLSQGMAYGTPPKVAVATAKAIWNAADNIAGARAQGKIREHIANLQAGPGGMEETMTAFNRIFDLTNTLQLRNMLETFSRGVTFGKGKYLLQGHFQAALDRHLSAVGLNAINKLIPEAMEYLDRGELPPAEILNKGAARMVDAAQGTYDYRQLPRQAMEGNLSPFLRWSRYDIGQLNVFAKNVIEPFLNGNPYPLIWATVGGLVGGEGALAIHQFFTGRKPNAPTYPEISQAKQEDTHWIDALTYRMAAVANMSSYMGMLATLTGAIENAAHGARVQALTNPSVQLLGNVWDELWNANEALNNGEHMRDVLPRALVDFVKSSMQDVRLALNNFSAEEQQQVARANALRDLNTWNIIQQGQPPLRGEGTANPLLNINERKFKTSEDPEVFIEGYKNSLDKIFSQFREDHDIIKLDDNMKKLENIAPLRLLPPSDDPMAQAKYIKWIIDTQGQEAASDLIMRYVRNHVITEAKKGMVPDLGLERAKEKILFPKGR